MAASTLALHSMSLVTAGTYRPCGKVPKVAPPARFFAGRLSTGAPVSPAAARIASSRVLGSKPACSPFRLHSSKPSNTPQEKHFEFREDVGECDIADVKDALEACKGLEGQALEDCWASFNCNVEKVTEHYAKVAGVEPKQKKDDADTSK